MTIIRVREGLDIFAENKDEARRIREDQLLPALEAGEKVILDFAGIRYATQSFVHALIGHAVNRFGKGVLRRLEFKNCTSQVREIVKIVVDYSLGDFAGPFES